MKIRHVLLRIAIVLLGIVVAIPCGIVAWLYFYTGGLPDVCQLKAFAPEQEQTAFLRGEQRSVVALPKSPIGANARNAVLAAEGDPDPRGWIDRYCDLFRDNPSHPRYGNYSFQIARMLPHDSYRGLRWQLWWLRTTIQIEHRFTPDEMLTIFMNTTYFGDDNSGNHIHGIHDASLHYVGKAPGELNPAEAALLAALINRPSYLSPVKHPDRAIAARNRVIDRMLAKDFLSSDEAQKAKEAALPTPARSRS